MRRVNRVLLYMFGVALIGMGLISAYNETREIVSGKLVGHLGGSVQALSYLTVGILFIVTAHTRYRGGSPTVIGACMVFLGVSYGGSVIDAFILGNTHPKVVDITTLVGVLLAAGFLFRAGHQLHQYRTKEDFSQLTVESTVGTLPRDSQSIREEIQP